MSRLRLLPVVLFAAATLLALKTTDLLLNGRLAGIAIASAQTKPAKSDAPEKAGGKAAGAKDVMKAAGKKIKPANRAGSVHDDRPEEKNLAERDRSKGAVLERLGERRVELDKREKDLDLREAFLKATEKRIEDRIDELKQLEARLKAATTAKEKAEEKQFDDLVKMYESMRPKEAAAIFDRLQMPVLVKVVKKINPRRMADILGKMTPEAAEKLTVALATTRKKNPPKTPDLLPKIGS